MALKVGELYGELALDHRPFQKGLDKSEGSAKGWASRVGSIVGGAAKALVKWGAIAGTAFAGFAYVSASSASDLAETVSKVGVVFGDLGDEMTAWAQDSAMALGMSQNAALTAAGTYGNLFRAMGIGIDTSAEMSTSLVELAADLASFNNQDPTEVLDKLRAGLVGETEPLRSLGVNLNQATIEAKAMELGLWDGVGSIDAAAKAQASYALILEQTSLAQGDFDKTSKGMANQQRILKATFQDTLAAIGAAFMPLIVDVLPKITAGLSGFAAWVTENMPAIQSTVEGVMTGIGLALDYAFGKLFLLIDAFRWLQENVLPGLTATATEFVDTAAVELADVFAWLGEHVLPVLLAAFDLVVVIVNDLGARFEWLMENVLNKFIDDIVPQIEEALVAVEATLRWVADNWDIIFPALVAMLLGVVVPAFAAWAAGAILAAGATIIALAPVMVPIIAIGLAVVALGLIWKTFGREIQVILGALVDWVVGIASSIGEAWSGMWDGITTAVKTGINTIIDLLNGFIRFVNGIQIHIPGFETPFGVVAKVDWGGLNLGTIPHLAVGARGFGGGMAMVGERGPELVNLPRGADVYSAGETAAMLGGLGSGRGPMIGQQTIYGVLPGDVERETERAFRRMALEWELTRS